MTYETTPGTLPHRALEYLKSRPPGTELSTAVFADIMGADIAGFSTTMANCLRAGLMKATTKPGNRRLLYWSLGDGVPPSAQAGEEDESPPQQTIVPASPGKWDASLPASTPIPPAPTGSLHKPKPLRVAEFSDGTMVLEKDGQTMSLDKQETTLLIAFVERRRPA